MSKEIQVGELTIRLDNSGKLDEIVIGKGDSCKFHLERISENTFWAAFYNTADQNLDGRDVKLYIGGGKRCEAEFHVEEIPDEHNPFDRV